MLNLGKYNIFLINICFVLLIILLANIFSQNSINENIKFTSYLFVFGIVVLLFFTAFFYFIYQFNELLFQIFTIFFLFGSSVIVIILSIIFIKNDPTLLLILIPCINILFLCLFIRINIWKIDREIYLENKRQKKSEKDKNKIII